MKKYELVREIKKHLKALSKERDALRDLIGDAEANFDNCEEAIDNLVQAVDKLSEYL